MKLTPAGNSHAGSPGPMRVSKSQMQRALARQAVREKELARYIPLECGHFTTRDEQIILSEWRPRGMAWCDKECQDWVKIKPPPPAPDYPQEPMFLWQLQSNALDDAHKERQLKLSKHASHAYSPSHAPLDRGE